MRTSSVKRIIMLIDSIFISEFIHVFSQLCVFMSNTYLLFLLMYTSGVHLELWQGEVSVEREQILCGESLSSELFS